MKISVERTPLQRMVTNLDLLVFGSAFLEIIFFFNVANVYGAIVLTISWIIIKTFCLTDQNFMYYPTSFLMMLGLGLFYYVLPMPLTLLEWKPITYNLRIPNTTFTHHGIFALTITFAHYIYVIFADNNKIRKLLTNTKFYIQPTDMEIWVSAFMGFFSAFYTYFIMSAWQVENADRGVGYYISAAFIQFIWMPLLLLFPKLRGYNKFVTIKQKNQIMIYSIGLLLIAIASNWRTILFSGIIILLIFILLSWLQGDFEFRKILDIKSIIYIILIIYIISGPMVDVGYAMVNVRSSRTDLSATDLISETFKAYSNKSELDAAKKDTSKGSDEELLSFYGWNEEYLSNAIENRFVNLKISDNCLFYAEEIGTPNQEMQNEMTRQLWALFPNIFLKILNINTEEKYSIKYSIGDYLYSIAINDSNVLGSAVISSMTGVGMSLFGYGYIFILLLMFPFIFYLSDAMSIPWNGKSIYSYLFFATVTTTLNFFNDRHVYVMDFRFLFRTFWESLAFFFICMFFIRIVVYIFTAAFLSKKIEG